MRAPRYDDVGTSGESEVLAQFERLGWAGSIDGRHDTGTDLYLRPRDARRYELGAVMGAQVKTGPSYFRSPRRRADGSTEGWWFAQDSEHFDHWLRHALPHVVILRDQETNESYWVHVTPERVISTGKGAKIFVPSSQTVGAEQNEALSDVALTQLPTPAWDGTAWTGAVHLSPADELRHALITPRLIAPHPNLTPTSITGHEALAMQVLLRGELERILRPVGPAGGIHGVGARWTGLPLDDARASEEWSWRATAALHLWHYEGKPEDLLSLADVASTPAERAAASVLGCAYHFDQNDPDAALPLLRGALEHDDLAPVDHAWLETQRARALLEIGQHQEAFDLALRTQRIHREVPSDVTAAAIAGANASTSFKATRWMQGDLANTIQRRDNPAAWWRTQLLASGLAAHLSEEFRTWGRSTSIRIGGTDAAQRQLLSAALLASCAGDHDGWRHATGALAEHNLTAARATDDPASVASRLTRLRFSGDSKSTGLATRHVVCSGPSLAARLAARSVDLTRSTRTTASSDLELLTAAGDVVEPAQADDICSWALATLRSPEAYLERTRPTFLLDHKIMDLLRSLMPAVGEEALQDVVEYFLDQPPVTDDGTAQTLARLIRAVPESAWSNSHRARAGARCSADAPYLREAYLAVAAPTMPDSLKEIHRRALDGDLIALEAVDDVRTLPAGAVDALVGRLCIVIDSLVDNAAKGMHTGGGLDPGSALSLLGVWHPPNARWDRVELLLGAPHVLSSERSGALETLAVHGDRLPEDVKDRLIGHVSGLRDVVPTRTPFDMDEDIRGLAAEAFASMTDDATRSRTVRELLGGHTALRVAAARIVERFEDPAEAEILLALTGDADESVRDAAICGLSQLVASERAPEGVEAFLAGVLESSGRRRAAAVVSRLHGAEGVPAASRLLAIAAGHVSAQIRGVSRGR